MPTKSVTPIAAKSSPHCAHINSRGQRCRMLPAHRSEFCAFHSRQAQAAQPDPEALAAELLRGIEDFSTADSINAFLGNLVRQLARKRITRRDAIAFGYLSQLLLNSLPALDRQDEAEKDAEASLFLRDVLLRPRDSQADDTPPERPAAPANFPS